MVGKVQVARVEHNRTGGPAQNGDLAVIDPHLADHPAEVLEGMLVAGQKMLQRFGSVNSRYILRQKANTMRKKDSRRCVEPTGTEPAQPQSTWAHSPVQSEASGKPVAAWGAPVVQKA